MGSPKVHGNYISPNYPNDPRPLKRRIIFVRNVEIEREEEEISVLDNPLDNIEDTFGIPDIKCLIRGEAIYGHLDKGGVEGQLKSGYPWREFYGKFILNRRNHGVVSVARSGGSGFLWSKPGRWDEPGNCWQGPMKKLFLYDSQNIVNAVIFWLFQRYPDTPLP
jgi:hypothetical protein